MKQEQPSIIHWLHLQGQLLCFTGVVGVAKSLDPQLLPSSLPLSLFWGTPLPFLSARRSFLLWNSCVSCSSFSYPFFLKSPHSHLGSTNQLFKVRNTSSHSHVYFSHVYFSICFTFRNVLWSLRLNCDCVGWFMLLFIRSEWETSLICMCAILPHFKSLSMGSVPTSRGTNMYRASCGCGCVSVDTCKLTS